MTTIRTRAIAVLPLIAGIVGFTVVARNSNDSSDATKSPIQWSSNPVGATRFCPGIPGGELADGGVIRIANIGELSIEANLTLFTADGRTSQKVTVEAHSTKDVAVADKQDVVSAVVEADSDAILVEQRSISVAGSIRTVCASSTSGEWYFADGFTASESDERIVLTNPYADAAIVNLSYSTLDGAQRPTKYQGFVLPAQSVRVLDMAEIGARNEQVLSVNLQATTGKFIAGRVQRYRGSGRQGLSVSLGSPRISGDWWFGFGDTTEGSSEQLIVYNPGESDASVQVLVTGYKPSDVFVEPVTVDVAAGKSAVVDMNSIANLPRGTHGISINSLGPEQVMVERVINVMAVNGQIATTVSQPIPQAETTSNWQVARVFPGERIAVLNVTGTASTFTVSSFGPAGLTSISELSDIKIAAGACVVVSIPDTAPSGPVIISSNVKIVVEMISSRGQGLLGYSAALAQPVQAR